MPHGQREPVLAGHPASLWDQLDILGYQGSWKTAHFPVMKKNVFRWQSCSFPSTSCYFLYWSVEYDPSCAVNALTWVMSGMTIRKKIIAVRLKWIAGRLKARWGAVSEGFNETIWVISVLFTLFHMLLPFVLSAMFFIRKYKDMLQWQIAQLFFSFFFPPLKFELNREIDFCFVLIFVLGKALTHNTQKATQAVSHKASTWCSCFWRDDSCFL